MFRIAFISAFALASLTGAAAAQPAVTPEPGGASIEPDVQVTRAVHRRLQGLEQDLYERLAQLARGADHAPGTEELVADAELLRGALEAVERDVRSLDPAAPSLIPKLAQLEGLLYNLEKVAARGDFAGRRLLRGRRERRPPGPAL